MRQALYRIYRPKSFDEVFGQDHIIPILENQIKTSTVSHAYLFAGPRGTGKTSTAKLFAKTLNQGSEIDTIELDAASNNSVDDIREIVDNAALAPFEGKYKIYILDEAHMLSKSAFNALLKTLEEPPAHVIFILATTEPERIPPTILSRTLRFDFAKIGTNTIIQRLKIVLENENIDYQEDSLYYIAEKSAGGLRDALSLLDKAISYGPLSQDNIQRALGSIDGDLQLEIVQAILENNISQLVQIIEEVSRQGIEARVFLLDLVDFLRRILLLQNGISQEGPGLKEAAQLLDDKQAAYMIESLSETINQMRSSPKPEAQMLASLVALASVNFSIIDAYKNIPAHTEEILKAQDLEIRRLQESLRDLQAKIENFSTYPQNPVDKPIFSVDKSPKATDLHEMDSGNLSTKNQVAPEKLTDVSQLNAQSLDPEEEKNLAQLKELVPQIRQELKDIRKVNISALLDMADPKRFIKDNVFFVYSGENRGLCKAILAAEPNQFLDPILSRLFQRSILTNYITEDQLGQIREDNLSSLLEDINHNFPEVPLDIE